MRPLRTLLICLAVLVPALYPFAGNRTLTQVYSNNDFQLTGVSVSKTGRLFVNFPRWSPEYLNAVVEAMPDGSSKPYPDEDWNRWDLDPQTAGRHFVCVQSVVADDKGSRWILDAAAPMLMSIVPGGPKLVQVDLATNKVTRVIPFDQSVARTHTYLNEVRIDTRRNFAYITDSGLGGIIVVDLGGGSAHRALDGDPSVMPDKSVKIVIDGKPVLGPTGQTPAFHSDAIALSPDGDYLYYQPMLRRRFTGCARTRCERSQASRRSRSTPKRCLWMASGWIRNRTFI